MPTKKRNELKFNNQEIIPINFISNIDFNKSMNYQNKESEKNVILLQLRYYIYKYLKSIKSFVK